MAFIVVPLLLYRLAYRVQCLRAFGPRMADEVIGLKKLLMLVTVALVACGDSIPTSVPAGPWGGTNVELDVTATGASALFKCGAVGRIDTALQLDDAGAFAVAGTYEPRLVQGGPRAARYNGRISGSLMNLSVTIGSEAPQTFDLTQGRAGAFEPCNF